MSEELWFRHANPWSGLTRFATYPFVILAFLEPRLAGHLVLNSSCCSVHLGLAEPPHFPEA
jgi:hypothetical protein